MTKHSHMFAGAMNLITNGKFTSVYNGFPICGDKYAHMDGYEMNIYKCDISKEDMSVLGNKKVTCPICIEILKKYGL